MVHTHAHVSEHMCKNMHTYACACMHKPTDRLADRQIGWLAGWLAGSLAR